jgi:hypothetical protein
MLLSCELYEENLMVVMVSFVVHPEKQGRGREEQKLELTRYTIRALFRFSVFVNLAGKSAARDNATKMHLNLGLPWDRRH